MTAPKEELKPLPKLSDYNKICVCCGTVSDLGNDLETCCTEVTTLRQLIEKQKKEIKFAQAGLSEAVELIEKIGGFSVKTKFLEELLTRHGVSNE